MIPHITLLAEHPVSAGSTYYHFKNWALDLITATVKIRIKTQISKIFSWV